MNKIKLDVGIFVFLLILTIDVQAQTIVKEMNINIISTRDLELFYVPIDRIDKFLDVGEE